MLPGDLSEAQEFAQSKGQAQKQGRTGVRFADVAGCGSILAELKDVVEVRHHLIPKPTTTAGICTVAGHAVLAPAGPTYASPHSQQLLQNAACAVSMLRAGSQGWCYTAESDVHLCAAVPAKPGALLCAGSACVQRHTAGGRAWHR